MKTDKIEIAEYVFARELASYGMTLVIYDAVCPRFTAEYELNIAHKKINENIQHINLKKLNYLNRVVVPIAMRAYDQSQSAGERFIPFELYSRYTKGLLSDRYFSYYSDSALNKNTYGVTYKKESFTYELSSGELMQAEELFTKNSHYKEILFSGIAEQIRMRIESGCELYKEDWRLRMLERFEARNYYLSNAGFCVYYEPYTIAGGDLGYVTFVIPYEAFGSAFKTN